MAMIIYNRNGKEKKRLRFSVLFSIYYMEKEASRVYKRPYKERRREKKIINDAFPRN
jgi:hypothetical protein